MDTYLVPADEDQPIECPHCQARTDFDVNNVHTCLGCGLIFRVEFETKEQYKERKRQEMM